MLTDRDRIDEMDTAQLAAYRKQLMAELREVEDALSLRDDYVDEI